MKEVWMDIPMYTGIYEVSTLGRVRSKITNEFAKPFKNEKGYLIVKIYLNGQMKNERVHRLVALTFIPNPNNYPQVNHIDYDRTNNRIDNLEWVSIEENQARAKKDAEANEKTMLKRTQELLAMYNEQCKTPVTGCVKLNGEIVPTIIAKNILCESKDLKTCRTKIETTFAKIIAGTEKATEITFGNNKIEIIKE